MIGFIINFKYFEQVYYPANSNDITEWADTVERSLRKRQSEDISSIVEMSELGKVENPFSETTGKYEEIQLRLKRIREIWSEGYNYHTKEIKSIESLISGAVELERFISDYWEYFIPDEKIRLVTQANLLKWYHQSIKNLTFRKWFKFVFPKRVFVLTKLYFKYRNNIHENPTNHVFIQLRNANLRLAELILNKAKEDFEKGQNAVSLKEHQALLKDYSSLEETTYLLRSPVNAERLLRSLEQIEAGQGVRRELME